MDAQRAEELIQQERDRISALLRGSTSAGRSDRQAATEPGSSVFDAAGPLAQELVDDALAERFSARLAALDRAEERLRAGTYGLSIRSGSPIPDERLEADPAAELCVGEAVDRQWSAPESCM